MFQSNYQSKNKKSNDSDKSSKNESSSINLDQMMEGHSTIPSLGIQAAQKKAGPFNANLEEEEKDGQDEAPAQRMVKDEDETKQLKENGTGGSSKNASPLISSGNSLPEDVQAKMENSFGTSFADVNIHQNDNSATDMGALAYTQGNDVHFAPGQYNPGSQAGQELIGHELTHVVQQRQGNVKSTMKQGGVNINDDSGLEHDADVAGKQAAKGVVQNKNANTNNNISNGNDVAQRVIDLSIQFDTYGLGGLKDGTVSHGQTNVNQNLKDMQLAAYNSFANGNPVTSMNMIDRWYYYNPVFTNSIYADRGVKGVVAASLANVSWWAEDVINLKFKYNHKNTQKRKGKFTVSSGSSSSETTTLSGGAEVTYGALNLSGSMSQETSQGRTSGTSVETEDYYQHDYEVVLEYSGAYYSNSNFKFWRDFFGPHMSCDKNPSKFSGSAVVGTCSVKDDDDNADNLNE